MKTEHGLTQQQEKFAQEVASGKSQAEAYRVAYPRSRNWKPESVYMKASELCSNVNVSTRVRSLLSTAADKAELDSTEIIREIRRLAVSDIAGIMHPNGKVKLPHELDPVTRAAVAGFEIDRFGAIKYKFWDKNSALERAAKIRGMFDEDNRQKAPVVVSEVRLIGLGAAKKGKA